MRSFKKEDIERRFIGIERDTLVRVDDIKPHTECGVKFDKKVSITIPGHPITDSRPRHTTNMTTGITHSYNPHKANLMKLFGEIYKDNKLLNLTTVLSPMKVFIRFYIAINKDIKKTLSKKELQALRREEIFCVTKKDNDNVEKVHFDTLQDFRYSVILRDEYIVHNDTRKYFVEDKKDERVEVDIIYGDVPKWLLPNLRSSTQYLKYTISMKAKLINNIKDADWQKHFYKSIAYFFKNNRIKKSTVLDNVEYVLSNHYSKEALDLIDSSIIKKDDKIKLILNKVEKLLGGIK